ncbi:hypothetical protein ND16A_0800 [Thalassotalea sp. ND16A]|nr:hypothetical protein ND16A_0800 [Thalassotalea sp. ND16A]
MPFSSLSDEYASRTSQFHYNSDLLANKLSRKIFLENKSEKYSSDTTAKFQRFDFKVFLLGFWV